MTIVTHPDCSGLQKTVSLESNCFLGDTSLWSGVDVTENIMAMESNYFLGDASLAAGCRFFYHCTSDFILQGFGWITQVNNVPFIAVVKLQAEFETFCSACRAVHYKKKIKRSFHTYTHETISLNLCWMKVSSNRKAEPYDFCACSKLWKKTVSCEFHKTLTWSVWVEQQDPSCSRLQGVAINETWGFISWAWSLVFSRALRRQIFASKVWNVRNYEKTDLMNCFALI